MTGWRLSPAQILAVGFLGLILAGGILLSLPFAAAPGHPLSIVDAFFTATSAVCVTGLIVVDTAHDLSVFGQAVVMLLIQAGGLGYMTITTLVAVALGRRVTLQERLTLQEALNLQSMEGLVRFIGTVLKVTVAFEAAGAVLLMAWWGPDFGFPRAAWLAVFHSISAFNNAGFSLFSDSLIRYHGDLFVNLVFMLLIVCGGVGFLVLSEVGRLRRQVPLSLHTRLVLLMTTLLIAAATVGIFLLERHNPQTLGPLSTSSAWLAAAFQGVTPRTAGFNTLDTGALESPTLFMLMGLMFTGGAPGGTAGGVKITTLTIILVALWATVRGAPESRVLRRRLPPELIGRAFFVCLIFFLALNAVAGLLLVIENKPLEPILFETVSAFGTVGLSTGSGTRPVSLVGDFSVAGKLLVMLAMFSGRLGPMTLAVALARGRPQPRLRYPEGKVLIG